MTLLLFLLAAYISGAHCSSSNKLDKRQTYGSTGFVPVLLAPSAQPPNIVKQFPSGGLIQQYPFPQQLQYVPEVPHLFPDRPIPATFSGGHFLGQLGQHIQQGIVNQYTGNFPFGPQLLNQFSGALGQYPGGQFYTQGQYPGGSTGVASALASIALYDDLKCVPRLLCEVAAGGRPGNSGSKQQDTGVPFVNRDTLLSLLTVLNVADSSPLMVFGRAILLGVTAKGNPNTCFSAYPECPRDPDRLVDYLNNHNGGFFRFFGTQRPYYPQHLHGRIQTGYHALPQQDDRKTSEGHARSSFQITFLLV